LTISRDLLCLSRRIKPTFTKGKKKVTPVKAKAPRGVGGKRGGVGGVGRGIGPGVSVKTPGSYTLHPVKVN
jgi:hypothetical protein